MLGSRGFPRAERKQRLQQADLASRVGPADVCCLLLGDGMRHLPRDCFPPPPRGGVSDASHVHVYMRSPI